MNDWVGVLGGHPDAHTPNIDRLAERGTLFANAHTAAPELRLTVSRDQAHRKRFGLHLFTGEGSEGLPVVIDPARKTLQVGSTEAPFAVADLPGDESVELRIFIDKYLVEVFVNGRQAMVAAHLDWQAHRGIDAYTYGTATTFEKIQIWKLKPTNEGYHVARKNRIWQPDSQ